MSNDPFTSRILVFVRHYLPGFNAGGPVKTIASTASRLFDEFEFRVITLDHDMGSSEPYDVPRSVWVPVGKTLVKYINIRTISILRIRQIITEFPDALIYTNSLFDSVFTVRLLLLKRVGLLGRRSILVAPRGELSKAALAKKSFKKRVWLSLSRVLRLYSGCFFQASTEAERSAILKILNVPEERVSVAPDLTAIATEKTTDRKNLGGVRAVFLARIARIKNLTCAIDAVLDTDGAVTLDIYGPIEDQIYWRECADRLQKSGGAVTYLGPIDPSAVGKTLQEYDVMLHPSESESFGHSIVEGLQAGLPVIIGSDTPWRAVVEKGAGWVVDVSSSDEIVRVLLDYSRLSHSARDRMRDSAVRYAAEISEDSKSEGLNRNLFRQFFQ